VPVSGVSRTSLHRIVTDARAKSPFTQFGGMWKGIEDCSQNPCRITRVNIAGNRSQRSRMHLIPQLG
jgi:hypothetical protein